jgi:hypothetical protein
MLVVKFQSNIEKTAYVFNAVAAAFGVLCLRLGATILGSTIRVRFR